VGGYVDIRLGRMAVHSPVDISLVMTPVYGAYNLGCPPHEVCLRDFAVERTGFEHVPKGAALDKVHHEVEFGGGLECTQQMGDPACVGLASLQENVPFELHKTLLAMG
jgi:hypothetical protein